MRALILPLLLGAAVATAQDTKTPPATKTTPAPATRQDAKTAAGTKQDTKAAAAQGTRAAQPGGRGAVAVAPPAAQRPPEVLREAFDYNAQGKRDPFNSLMGSGDLRPTVSDLKLVGVLYHPTRPIAVMRDITTNTQYRVTLGATLGRMRVALIRPRVVIFSIEEFGLNRQDSLVLGDTSKVRSR